MGYSLLADVQGEFAGQTFGTAGKVLASDINKWIDQAEAEINGYIGDLYVIPVTASAASEILKHIEVELVAFRVERKLNITPTVGEGEFKRVISRRAEALRSLEKIREGKLVLTGADKQSSTDGAESFASVNVGVEHTFKKGEDQW